MPLNGELNDLSLSELIEFFCNQRKSGRLEVFYQNGSAQLYLQSGSLVHAEIGVLRGVEAVYYALTQANASFKFSPQFEAREQTINQPWSSVVLEGLRRMDEGITPAKAFPEEGAEPTKKAIEQAVAQPTPADRVSVAQQPAERVETSLQKQPVAAQQPAKKVETHLEKEPVAAQQPAKSAETSKKKEPVDQLPAVVHPEVFPTRSLPKHSPATSPLFAQVESSGKLAYRPWKLAAIVGAVLLAIAVIALPRSWYARSNEARPNAQAQPATTESAPPSTSVNSTENVQPAATSNDSTAVANETTTNSGASASPANGENRRVESRRTDNLRPKTADAGTPLTSSTTQAPAADPNQRTIKPQSSPASVSKRVTVQVTYDENGRVTQASGGDATALRIARQKRFPAGKPGSATVTIPIN